MNRHSGDGYTAGMDTSNTGRPGTARLPSRADTGRAVPAQTTLFGASVPIAPATSTRAVRSTATVTHLDANRDSLDCALITLDMPQGWQKSAVGKSEVEVDEIRRRALLLSAGQREPLNRKIDFALRVMERAQQTPANWALSFSAGRDSTVLSHLAVEVMGWKLPHVMSNTRMEHAETLRQAGRWRTWLSERGTELHTVYPDRRPGEVWTELGLPLFSKEYASKVRQFQNTGNERHLDRLPDDLRAQAKQLSDAGIKATEQCCDALKKDPMHAWDARNGITGHLHGVRAEESRSRRMIFLQQGALYHSTRHKQWLSAPLIHWTREDIDTYIARNKIPIEFTERTGCVTCMFGAHLSRGMNALEKLHRENPKMWNEALDGWKYRDALDLLQISYRAPVTTPLQENIYSEFGLGSRQATQIVVPEMPRTIYDRLLDRLPSQTYGEHILRLDRRGATLEQCAEDGWMDAAALRRGLDVPMRELADHLNTGVREGLWEVRYRTDHTGWTLPEFRPRLSDAATASIDDLAVAQDRIRHGRILDDLAARRAARQAARRATQNTASSTPSIFATESSP
jgi:3'-phosphoadenosine 5'-phosphosulfate sulfotransferase (PAPS reductase)/FAD synthetase